MKKIILYIILMFALCSFVNAGFECPTCIDSLLWYQNFDTDLVSDFGLDEDGFTTTATNVGVGGMIGGYFHCDGDDDIITFANIKELLFNGTDNFTISFCIKATQENKPLLNFQFNPATYKGWHISGGDANGGVVFTHTDDDSDFTSNRVTNLAVMDNTWHCMDIVSNGTGQDSGIALYVDGLPDIHWSGGSGAVGEISGHTTNFSICQRSSSPWAFKEMDIDELSAHNRALSKQEIRDKWRDTSNGTRAYDVAEPLLNMTFRNETNHEKTTFDEGENFNVFLDWTFTSDVINDSNGFCNITLLEGVVETESPVLPFTLCTSGCNFTTFDENLTQEKTNTTQEVLSDSIHLEVCHESVANRDLTLFYQCGTFNNTRVFDSSEFNSCSGGFTSVFESFMDCITFNDINLSFTNSAVFNQRHKLQHISFDREFKEDINENGTDVIFNTTLQLWQTVHTHEYYKHGTKNISANCIHNTDSTKDINTSENIIIVNLPPLIFYIGFLMPNGTIDASNIIEFQSGFIEIIFAIIDDDLTGFMLNISNATQSIFNTNNFSLDTFNTDLFVNFLPNNPYNLSIFAIDSLNANSSFSRLFNFTDNTIPVATGFEDVTVIVNNNHTWNGILTDSYLWSFNMSCDNGFNFFTTSIGKTEYVFNGSTNITSDTNCTGIVKDGHTANVMKDLLIVKDELNNKVSFGQLSLSALQNIAHIEVTDYVDKYSFCFELKDKEDELDIIIPDNCDIAPNSPYKGHYVCEGDNLAIDFEGDNPIKSMSQNLITIDISKSKTNNICFNSIVELNTLEFNQFIETITDVTPSGSLFKYCVDISSVGNILLLFTFIFFYIGLIAISLFFNNYAFGLMGFCVGVIIAMMMVCFSSWLMIALMLINVLFFFSLMGVIKL